MQFLCNDSRTLRTQRSLERNSSEYRVCDKGKKWKSFLVRVSINHRPFSSPFADQEKYVKQKIRH
jgi:hypothetical protein